MITTRKRGRKGGGGREKKRWWRGKNLAIMITEKRGNVRGKRERFSRFLYTDRSFDIIRGKLFWLLNHSLNLFKNIACSNF